MVSSTIVAAPVVIGMEAVTIIMGLIRVVWNRAIKKMSLKIENQEKIAMFAVFAQNTISSLISKGIIRWLDFRWRIFTNVIVVWNVHTNERRPTWTHVQNHVQNHLQNHFQNHVQNRVQNHVQNHAQNRV